MYARTIGLLITCTLCSIAGCPTLDTLLPPEGDQELPKSISVSFRSLDIGTDDCEDLFSRGDFTLDLFVFVEAREVFQVTRFAELGSAAFQNDIQTLDIDEAIRFDLQPGERFEVSVTVTEDDTINSTEPQPWSFTREFDYAAVFSRDLSEGNGPGCFRDDRVDYTIRVE